MQQNTFGGRRSFGWVVNQWALKEEIHAASPEWQPVMNNDKPIGGDACMYDLRRLAHLAVKWVIISSFDSAERKEHEPICFSGSQVTMTTQPQQHKDNTEASFTRARHHARHQPALPPPPPAPAPAPRPRARESERAPPRACEGRRDRNDE